MSHRVPPDMLHLRYKWLDFHVAWMNTQKWPSHLQKGTPNLFPQFKHLFVLNTITDT